MSISELDFLTQAWAALSSDQEPINHVSFVTEGALPSAFAVTNMAAAAVAAASLSVAQLISHRTHASPAVAVDRRLASLWFGSSLDPIGWQLPPVWDSLAGDYQTQDGWIKLHTNAPRHRRAALRVLGNAATKADLAQTVLSWNKVALESAVVEAGGCAAAMQSDAEWIAHPQGIAANREPLIAFEMGSLNSTRLPHAPTERPLQGIRVLDCTRILAGPVATRFLAGYGAEILRIDPPRWDEPSIAPEVTLGKRCARLDLHNDADRRVFEDLLARADVFVHGYRPTALDALGLGHARRHEIAPGLIDVTLNAYGWSGPWRERRGYDSLVQMSSGIAEAGGRWKQADVPVSLPVQALDHATGYLIAASVVQGIIRRQQDARGMTARLSLARTAKWLMDAGLAQSAPALAAVSSADQNGLTEITGWGEAKRLRVPARIESTPMFWSNGARTLGSDHARWIGHA
jgi:CoA-transferase family III